MKKALLNILSLAFLAFVVYILWIAGEYVLTVMQKMDEHIQPAVIALIGAVSVPIITFLTQWWMSKRNSREEAIRDKRAEFYSSVIVVIMSMFMSSKQLNEESTDFNANWVRELESLVPQMILYGSRDFVRAWNTFRLLAIETSELGGVNENNMHYTIAAMEMLLVEARRDLGHRVKDDEQGDYARIFINDVEASEIQKAYKEIKNRQQNGRKRA